MIKLEAGQYRTLLEIAQLTDNSIQVIKNSAEAPATRVFRVTARKMLRTFHFSAGYKYLANCEELFPSSCSVGDCFTGFLNARRGSRWAPFHRGE
jgi:hypothetical protein